MEVPRPVRRRGRPPEVPPLVVLEHIRKLSNRREGLFRIHLTHGDLYARARRQFGSWEAAVRAAGCNSARAIGRARDRARERRRNRRRILARALPDPQKPGPRPDPHE